MESKISLEEKDQDVKIKQTRVLAEEAYSRQQGGQWQAISLKRTGSIILIIVLFVVAILILMLPITQKEGLSSSITIFFIVFAVRLINSAWKK